MSTKFTIPIFKLEFDDDYIEEFLECTDDILRSGRPLAEGYYVKKFCDQFSVMNRSKFCTMVSNGTAALELALKALPVQGKVIIPTNTFFATAVAVENSGNEILLADSNTKDFGISFEDIKKLSLENSDVIAVVVVHIGGIISKDIFKIKEFCEREGIFLIEDAAHAHLSELEGTCAGNFGDIGCFSLFPTKVMTSGEGGIVVTNNKELFDKILSLKNFGRDLTNSSICVLRGGSNYKVTELQGLHAYLDLKRVIKRIFKRNELLSIYERTLDPDKFQVIKQSSGTCSYYKAIVRQINGIDEDLEAKMKSRGVSMTGKVYGLPVHMQPAYRQTFNSFSYPVADKFAMQHCCPPLYPELTPKEVQLIATIMNELKNEK